MRHHLFGLWMEQMGVLIITLISAGVVFAGDAAWWGWIAPCAGVLLVSAYETAIRLGNGGGSYWRERRRLEDTPVGLSLFTLGVVLLQRVVELRVRIKELWRD